MPAKLQILNTEARYGLIAQLFHWLIVGLIVSQFVLAEIFEGMPLGLEKIGLIVRHKELGMLILILALLRLVWKWLNPRPALPPGLRRYEGWLAQITHILLYALIMAIPLSGWLMSSLAKIPVTFFGLWAFPDLIGPDKSLVGLSKDIHQMLTTTLLIVSGLHILAALKHHFILKDDVLMRMLPFSKKD